jgi:predicted nucleic acid-binding protein
LSLYLLDSDCVIDYLNNRRAVVDLVQGLFELRHTLCTCDVVLAEVHAGTHPPQEDTTSEFMTSLEYLHTTRPAAIQAGRWRYAAARRGEPLPLYDCLIAATAFGHDATVVTGNVRDYPMPEVSVLPLPR